MEDFEKIKDIHRGRASENITDGCLVLEGGAWRGLYTQGVLDTFMENDINIQTTLGVSAGAMAAMTYLSGQIGLSASFNLGYRHDQNYFGVKAMAKDHGVTGFSFLFEHLSDIEPLDKERFFDPKRRLVVTCTNIETGETEYFEKKDSDEIFKAIQASASVPYVTEAVEINGKRYLDGGISCKLPYFWAFHEGFKKVVVVRTRAKDFRKTPHRPLNLTHIEYKRYPALQRDLLEEVPNYNLILDRLDQLEEQGRVYVLAPSKPVNIHRFEGDLNTLFDIYDLGRRDALEHLEEIRSYLNS